MDTSIATIPLPNLALALIPVAMLIGIMAHWSAGPAGAAYAVARMLLQLVLIGYALTWIFATDSAWVIVGVLTFMLCAASWIALRPVAQLQRQSVLYALLAISLSGCFTLALIVLAVLETDPWYQPRVVLPLAGMIFASAMNAVSIAAERYAAETERSVAPGDARRTAFQAALIPLFNSLLAVGLVSLPGMMTGQILSGVDPLIAARYQVMVMCMLTGAAGIAAALYLQLLTRKNTP